MISDAAKKKKAEAIEFFEKQYKLGIKYRGKTPQEKRDSSRKFAESMREARYPNCVIENIHCNGVPCEKMALADSTADIVLVFLHSGGLSAGSVESGRIFSSYFVEKKNCIAILPDFRLAPEVYYKEILGDCVRAYRAIREQYRDRCVVLAGISSGGLLALGLMQLLHQSGEMNLYPDLLLLGSAVTFLGNQKDSNLSLAAHDIVLRSYDDERLLAYGENEAWKRGVLMNPLSGVYENFPPTYIGCGSDERLLDDSVLLFKKIKKNATNGETYLSVFPGMWHGFWEDNMPETFEELERIWKFVSSIASIAKDTDASQSERSPISEITNE